MPQPDSNAPNSTPRHANLDSYIQSARPQPEPLATSQEIRDRGSTFIANVYQAISPEEARSRIQHLKHVVHGPKPASHEIAAWRCMVLKHGRTGLGGPDDFGLNIGSIDDGERWAGGRVLRVMQAHAVIDAVVIVSRWYGGTLLGPARFSHIETCTTEVCLEFKRSEGLRESISTLTTLDIILADLRSEYNNLVSDITYSGSSESQPSSSQPRSSQAGSERTLNYSNLDLPTAKRLVKARENAIKSVKLLLVKRRGAKADE